MEVEAVDEGKIGKILVAEGSGGCEGQCRHRACCCGDGERRQRSHGAPKAEAPKAAPAPMAEAARRLKPAGTTLRRMPKRLQRSGWLRPGNADEVRQAGACVCFAIGQSVLPRMPASICPALPGRVRRAAWSSRTWEAAKSGKARSSRPLPGAPAAAAAARDWHEREPGYGALSRKGTYEVVPNRRHAQGRGCAPRPKASRPFRTST